MHDNFPSESVYGDYIYVDDYYMGETWEYIPGFSNYMISSKSRVWSISSQKFLKPKPLDAHGHLGFCLYENGIRRYVYLHRLMGQVFIPNSEDYPLVRHLDDDPTNNQLDNLAWGTQRDNWFDSVGNGTAKPPTDEDREIGCKKTRTPIRATNIKTGEQLCFSGQGVAARSLDLQQANIWKVLNGYRAQTEGWFFEYLKDGDICAD